MTISQRVQDVRARRAQGLIGKVATASLLIATFATLINSAPQAQQGNTVTVTAAADDTVYNFALNGVDISINSGVGATTTTIATALAAKANAEPLTRGQVSATSATNVVTLTALIAGVVFTCTEAHGSLTTAAVTTAAEADSIPFGRLLISRGYQTGTAGIYTDGEASELGALPLSSRFTAQVDTAATPYVAAANYTVAVTYRGVTYSHTALANTDTATTGIDIAAGLNAILPANTVEAAGVATGVSLTAEIPGEEFSTTVGADDSGASVPVVAVTSNKAFATSLNKSAGGVSLWTADEENVTVAPVGGDVVYPPNAGVRAIVRGDVWVANSQSPTKGAAVYVETAAGADLGTLFSTASATRVLLTGASWQRAARASSGDLVAVVRLAL